MLIRPATSIVAQDGHLNRRTKELIASFVSALNQGPYRLGSHAFFLQLQGADDEVAEAIRRCDIDSPALTETERILLRFVKLVTETAYRVTADDVRMLRESDWTDPQIAEAVYITAVFAFYNRLADAFGLEDPCYTLPGSKPSTEG